MYNRIEVRVPERLQHTSGALNVRLERVERSAERRPRIALRSQVENEIGFRRLDCSLDRDVVAQVAVHQLDPVPAVNAIQVVLDVV